MGDIMEQADEYMERIQRIYDEHLDMMEKMIEEEDAESDELVKTMVLAEYNLEGLEALYELSPGEFCEYCETAMAMEDVDIWLDLLLREAGR